MGFQSIHLAAKLIIELTKVKIPALRNTSVINLEGLPAQEWREFVFD